MDIINADRQVAVIRFCATGKVQHIVVDAAREGLEAALGGRVTLRETNTTVIVATLRTFTAPQNVLAETVQSIYGLSGDVYGDMIIAGYDGEGLRDAPGAARLALLGR